jgi:hypothetical protein
MKKFIFLVVILLSMTSFAFAQAETAEVMTAHGESADFMALLGGLNVFRFVLFFGIFIIGIVSLFFRKREIWGFTTWHLSILLFLMLLSTSLYPQNPENVSDMAIFMLAFSILLLLFSGSYSVIVLFFPSGLKRLPSPISESQPTEPDESTLITQMSSKTKVLAFVVVAFSISLLVISLLQLVLPLIDPILGFFFGAFGALLVLFVFPVFFFASGKEPYIDFYNRESISRGAFTLIGIFLSIQWLLYMLMELKRLFWSEPMP